MTGLESRASLQTRVGIATGLVVVGDLIGSGDARERGIVGETPNLAARLQGIAEPNTVVIADGTRRLLGNIFELEDLGPRDLKGIVGPARAWAALRASSVESRFDALHTTGLTALVGREEESELLLRRWSRAKMGEGQVVLLSGEAGIGKSRLTAAFLERLATEPHTRLRYFCSPQHTDSALYPIIGQMERAAGLAHDDKPRARLDKLDALLAQNSTSIQDAALFAEMLSVPNDGRYPALDLTPEQRRQRTLEALISQLEALTRRNPVLMIFEDAHWTDPTSLEVFDRTVDRIATLRVLLIVTFRPEFDPPWIGRPHVTALTINRLAQREVSAMIDLVVGNKLLAASIRQDIIERTDGIPLFVEEMTKAVLEAESEGAARRTVAAVPSPALAIPASLHASLMARLDRLGAAKEVAQIGAAIGRGFSHALLASVVRETGAELGSALDRLIQAGLLFRQGVPPHASYLFKHALVQDAAYGMLLREPRRALHARIAEALESQFAEIAESQPERLAHHAVLGEMWDKALQYLRRASAKAMARSANQEAVSCFEQALVALPHLPETREMLEQAVDLRFELRGALHQLGQVERSLGYLREAESLARELDDQRRLARVSIAMSHHLLVWTGSAEEARMCGERAHDIAQTLGDLPLQIAADLYLGTACVCLGELRHGEECLGSTIRLLDGDLVRERFGLHGFPAAIARPYLAWALAERGDFRAAIARGQEGVDIADAVQHKYSLAFACWGLGCSHVAQGDLAQGARVLEPAVALCRDWNLPQLNPVVSGLLGLARARSGRVVDGVALLLEAVTTMERSFVTGIFHSLNVIWLGEALLLSDRLEDARSVAEQALALTRESKHRVCEPWALRLLGEIGAHRDPPDVVPADAAYRQALTLAEDLGMRPLVAHCQLGLGKLYGRSGERQEADQHLTIATTMYREMAMGFWLTQAETELPPLG